MREVSHFKISKINLLNTCWLPKWLKWLRFNVVINIYHPPGYLITHNHRWDWISIPLWGGYLETMDGKTVHRGPFNIRWKKRDVFHALEIKRFTVTIYITSDYDVNAPYYIKEDGIEYLANDFRKKYEFTQTEKIGRKYLIKYRQIEFTYSEPTLHGEELQDNFAYGRRLRKNAARTT